MRMLTCNHDYPPTVHYDGDAGLDLFWFGIRPLEVKPGELLDIGSGVYVDYIEPGQAFHIAEKGSYRLRWLRFSAGQFDRGYRGEVMIRIHNLGTEPVIFNPGDSMCQIVAQPFEEAQYAFLVNDTPPMVLERERGANGGVHVRS